MTSSVTAFTEFGCISGHAIIMNQLPDYGEKTGQLVHDFPKHISFIMNTFACVNSLTHNSPKDLGAT